jgi:LPXTG-motif cell wall-anchored protein
MGGKALCGPFAAGPPRHRPFTYLGKAKPVFDLDHPPENVWAANYRLKFRIPRVRPGPYAFVTYLGFSGGLAVDRFRNVLHVRRVGSAAPAANGTGTGKGRAPSAAPAATNTGTAQGWWIAGGAALLLLAGGAALLGLRRRHEGATR